MLRDNLLKTVARPSDASDKRGSNAPGTGTRWLGILGLLVVSQMACGGPQGPAKRQQRAPIAEVQIVTDKKDIESRDCVVVGRVLTRGGGGATASDLKDQARSLESNVIYVSAYAFKRRHLNYNVKGTAYYCY